MTDKPLFENLIEEINNPATTQQRRSQVGEQLAAIVDRRSGVGLVSLPLTLLKDGEGSRLWGEHPDHIGLPDIVWLPVGSGQVTLEGTAGTFSIQPFAIAKYLITHAQFQAFIDDGGYQTETWWKDLAADSDLASKPATQQAKFDNYPRDTVSWYDAVAFTRWLSARTGIEVRLPTEWEWQFAATGGNTTRVYPWGPDWDAERINTVEGGPGRTTAVGMYPLGAAPCGALDVSGNVWEWCLNDYGEPSKVSLAGANTRALRGGSYHNDPYPASTTCRFFSDPSSRKDYRGFRVVSVSNP